MANAITDPGHELGNPAWVEVDTGAERIDDVDKARAGTWSMRSQGRWGEGSYVWQGRFGQQFTTPDLIPRRLRYSIRLDRRPLDTRWEGRVWLLNGLQPIAGPVDGNEQVYLKQWFNGRQGSPEYPPLGEYVDEVSPLIYPTGTDLTLVVYNVERFTELEPPFPILSINSWNFDEWSFLTDAEFDLAIKRREIRDTVVTLIGTITVANSHAVEVASVDAGYVRLDKITKFPNVQVIFGEENRAHGSTGGRITAITRKNADLTLRLLITCTGSSTNTAEDECEEILASAEKVLEAQSSNQWMGLSYINGFVLVGDEITPFPVDEDDQLKVRRYIVDVLVAYGYNYLNP